jgi:hypothetical protein
MDESDSLSFMQQTVGGKRGKKRKVGGVPPLAPVGMRSFVSFEKAFGAATAVTFNC